MDRFAQAARAFCAWSEAAPRPEQEELRLAQVLLTDLYRAALDLPEGTAPDLTPDGCTPEHWRRLFQRFGALPISYYSETPDPTVVPGGEAVTGDVADDLADTFSDLSRGLPLYEAGRKDEAAWVWLFHFRVHWGDHATGALRALHAAAGKNAG